MEQVFISYKSEDYNEALFMKRVLEVNGISCWMAPSSIPGGSDYASEIPRAIRGCTVFIVLLTERTQSSQWVPKELDRAVNEKKIIMPFMLDDCTLNDAFNFYLSNVQRYAAYENKANALQKMVSEIQAILNIRSENGVVLSPDESDRTAPAAPKAEAPKETPKKVKTPKPKKTKEAKPKKEKVKKEKTNKSRKPLLLGIGGALLAVVLLVTALALGSRVTVCGKRLARNTFSTSFKECTLTDEDVATLLRLKKLRGLDLTGCKTSEENYARLLSSSQLYTLTLDGCDVTDEALEKADFKESTISILSFENTAVSDITPLAGLKNGLYELNISHTDVRDLAPLAGMLQLNRLYADALELTDISALSELTGMTELSLNDNKIASLKALSGMNSLVKLQCNNNALKDLTGLENALELELLHARGNRIGSLNGITNCTQLKDVDLANNAISDVAVLKKSEAKLQQLTLDGNELTDSDMVSLDGCTGLWLLSLNNTAVSSLDSFSKCRELSMLRAANCSISSVPDTFTKLTEIDLSGNELTDTAFIKNVAPETGSLSLDLSHNRIERLTLPAVRFSRLFLYDNRISDYSALEGVSCFKCIVDYADGVNYDAIETVGLSLVNCPPDKQVNTQESVAGTISFLTLDEADEAKDAYNSGS